MKKIIFSLISMALLTNCSGGASSSSFGSPTSSALSPEGPSGASDGVSVATDFYIAVDPTINTIAHVHKKDTYSSKCSITPGANQSDLTCIIDIPEAEIYMNGVSLVHHLPPNMCRYLRRTPYWFYNKEIGTGPSSISISRIYKDGVLDSFSCSVDGSPVSTSCNGFSEVTINPANLDVKCNYDLSWTQNGTNCCLGTYSLTVDDTKNITAPISSSNSVSTTANSWGGNAANCTGGVSKEIWPYTGAVSGLPLSVVDKSRSGLDAALTMKPPIETISTRTSINISNYFTPVTHTHDGFVSAATSTLPYFIDPIDDRSGSAVTSGHESYEYECLDEAFETLHRIRVYIREWDTYQDFTNYVDSKGATEVPDRGSGLEGINCIGFVGNCNDMYDSDDFVNLILGAPYDTTAPSTANRIRYFPFIDIK